MQPESSAAALPPVIDKVVRSDLCTGCGLCAGLSDGGIAMHIDAAGFARPRAQARVAADAAAAMSAACPGAVVAPWRPAAHPYWGPIDRCLTGHATDPAVRHAGSSGGMLSALAIHALETGVVDAIVHIAASTFAPLENAIRISSSAATVIAGAGSRYGPSPTLGDIETLLAGEGRYLLIGKPCDISAMRSLATVDPRVDRRFVAMLSFFCGGMPSLHGSEAIVRDMGLDPEALTDFRYRGDGWPGLARARDREGRIGEMSYERSWGTFLSGRVQYRCKICPDAVGGVADIACADAWYGGETGYPQFDEQDGRSLALVRSAAGAALLDGAIAAGRIAVSPLDLAEIDLMQPSQARRKRMIAPRSLAARVLFHRQPRMRGLKVLGAFRKASLTETIRNFSGSVVRIVRGRK